ncbi:movement protein P4 [Rose spring dwarf-associated virus]|uniref:Movement protein P4 n=1 Tax=Rose spring dwarf-associated virus TaxID=474454 RepID=B3FHC2_9TOMB|nr:movement protein P4 [Rose spring dwarf-associated virus]ABV89769.1 movement protein P4 [Rose spring dwarf-associated virus]
MAKLNKHKDDPGSLTRLAQWLFKSNRPETDEGPDEEEVDARVDVVEAEWPHHEATGKITSSQSTTLRRPTPGSLNLVPVYHSVLHSRVEFSSPSMNLRSQTSTSSTSPMRPQLLPVRSQLKSILPVPKQLLRATSRQSLLQNVDNSPGPPGRFVELDGCQHRIPTKRQLTRTTNSFSSMQEMDPAR